MCITYQEIQKDTRIVRKENLHRAGGERENRSLSMRRQEKNGGHPGIIRNITFDHISMTAESSLFIAGEEDAVIEDVIVENLNLTLKQQGTQKPEFLIAAFPERRLSA